MLPEMLKTQNMDFVAPQVQSFQFQRSRTAIRDPYVRQNSTEFEAPSIHFGGFSFGIRASVMRDASERVESLQQELSILTT